MLSVAKNYILSFYALNKEARTLLFFYFLRSISAGMTFFISIFLAHIHMKISIIGLEVSAIAIGNMVGAWLAARYSDKFNPYTLSSLSLLAQGFCFISIALLQKPIILAALIFLNGIAGYFYISVSSLLITEAAGQSEIARADAIGYKTVMSNFGIGIGGVIIALCTPLLAYMAFISMGIALIILAYCYIYHTKEKVSRKAVAKNLNAEQENQSLLALSLVSVGLMGIIIGIQRVGMQFFYEENFTPSQVSFVIMLNTIIIILCMPGLTSYLKNKSHCKYLGLGGLALGVGTYLHLFCATLLSLSLLCVIRTFGEMLMAQESEFLCFQSAKPERRGRALGWYKLIFSLGTTFGAITSGELLELLGINVVWNISALIGVVSIAICFLYKYYEQMPAKRAA